jgi:hypothetical protein
VRWYFDFDSNPKVTRVFAGCRAKHDPTISSFSRSSGFGSSWTMSIAAIPVPWRQPLPDARLHQPQNWRELGSLQIP